MKTVIATLLGLCVAASSQAEKVGEVSTAFILIGANHKVVVEAYVDHASGTLTENSDGSGQFSEVVLHPVVTVKEKKMVDKALSLHHDANQMCFISRSVKFPVRHEPQILVQ